MFASSFLYFLGSQADRLIVGAATSVAKLGIYHVAAMIASVPTVMVGTLANSILMPYFSRLRHHSSTPHALTLKAYTLAGIFAWSLAALLVIASQDVIDLFYRGPYEEAGLMVPIVAVVAWFQMLQASGGAILPSTWQSPVCPSCNGAEIPCHGCVRAYWASCGRVAWLALGIRLGRIRALHCNLICRASRWLSFMEERLSADNAVRAGFCGIFKQFLRARWTRGKD